jgi:hypothetical protein
LFSQQPINQKRAQVFYLNYVYGSNKSGAKKGDLLFSPYDNPRIAGYDRKNYSSEIISDELFESVDSTNTETDFSGHLQSTPVKPGTLRFTTGDVVVADNGAGQLTGAGVTGKVSYETGEVELTFGTAPTDLIMADYEYDNTYAPANVPELDMQIKEFQILAQTYKLRSRWSFDAAQDLKASQGLNLSDSVW